MPAGKQRAGLCPCPPGPPRSGSEPRCFHSKSQPGGGRVPATPEGHLSRDSQGQMFWEGKRPLVIFTVGEMKQRPNNEAPKEPPRAGNPRPSAHASEPPALWDLRGQGPSFEDLVRSGRGRGATLGRSARPGAVGSGPRESHPPSPWWPRARLRLTQNSRIVGRVGPKHGCWHRVQPEAAPRTARARPRRDPSTGPGLSWALVDLLSCGPVFCPENVFQEATVQRRSKSNQQTGA